MNGATILPDCQASKSPANAAVPRHQFAFRDVSKLTDAHDAVAVQAAFQRGTHAPQHGNRLVGEERNRIGATNDAETAGLVEIRRDLGERFIVAQANRRRDADFFFDTSDQANQNASRKLSAKHAKTGKIEERFINRDRLDFGGRFFHQRADRTPRVAVLGHVRLDYCRVGTSLQRPPHGHRFSTVA